MKKLKLISHETCPFVQRAVIMLNEKGVEFERVDIDLANKPDWFLEISPFGKVPVLVVSEGDDENIIFESNVILEYLDESFGPQMHPSNLERKALHRSWVEFGSQMLGDFFGVMTAKDDEALKSLIESLTKKFETLDVQLAKNEDGNYFDGNQMNVIDTVFAPAFRYNQLLEDKFDIHLLKNAPKTKAWADHMMKQDSVINAVKPDYLDKVKKFMSDRDSLLAQKL